MQRPEQQFAWLARDFGRTDYLPLSPADLDALSRAGEFVEKYPGTHLFKQGERSQHAYVIERGRVELYRGSRDAGRIVHRVGSGTVLGDIAMFSNEPYRSSAKAIEPTAAFRFDRDKLLPLLVQRPVITLRWLIAGLDQLEATQRRVLGLMHRTVKQQVAEVLLDEIDDRSEVHLSQASLASLLGASRQTVNEALGELSSDGLTETGYRLIRVLDHPKLEELAGRT